MTVKEFLEKSDVSQGLDFEICDAETKALLYDKSSKPLKDLMLVLDTEITTIYISQSTVRLYVK